MNRKKWVKWTVWILLSPFLIFIILMIMLYIPPVQSFLREEVTSYASEKTGLDISARRMDLRFPLNLLLSDVCVVQHSGKSGHAATSIQKADTLFSLERLNVRVQAWPLLQGKIELDELTLSHVSVDSYNLLSGMRIKGVLGRFFFESHGVDLINKNVVINSALLSDTHVKAILSDTTQTKEDTVKTSLLWKIALHTLQLKNVSIDLQLPLDSTRLAAHVGNAELKEGVTDLKRQFYGWKTFRLGGSSLSYDVGKSRPVKGFDASHIAVRDVSLGMDSVMMCGRNLNAVIRNFSLNERSGLSVISLAGRLFADSTVIHIPSFHLLTPYSEMDFSGMAYWKMVDYPTNGELTAQYNARIGKQDVLLFAGGLPDTFKDAYPFRPLVIHAGIKGNLSDLQVSRLTADLPGAFSLKGDGGFTDLADSLRRKGNLDVEVQTGDLNFLTRLTGLPSDGSLVIPDSMRLDTRFSFDGLQTNVTARLQEEKGLVNLAANYDEGTGMYDVGVDVDSLQLHHFLPKDSLYLLTAQLGAKGKGFDLNSPRTTASVHASLGRIEYGGWNVTNMNMHADLKSLFATFNITSDNVLLKMHSTGDLRLGRSYLDGKLSLNVEQVDLYKLGIAPSPLKHPFAFDLETEAHRDSIRLAVNAGDLSLSFRARSTIKKLLSQSDEFIRVLMKQIGEKHLDHATLRRALPSAGMRITAGKENPLNYYLATKNMAFDDFVLRFGFTPRIGINGRTAIHGLRMDSLRLDTIFFAIKQDTARMTLQGGVINGPKNPQFVFRGTMTGEIRNNDAELNLKYIDGEGDTGLELGVNARPLTGKQGKGGDGMLFRLTPAEPIIAFRKFHFVDNNNWIYLHKNMRVYASVDILDKEGMGFRMHSVREDTVSLQNMDVELRRIRLDEISRILPYMPAFSGLFSADLHYIQKPTSLQLSTEANVENLTYERRKVGNVGLGVTWLPGDKGTHYLNAYFTSEGNEVMSSDAVLKQRNGKDSIEVNSHFEHFPLTLANAFIPDRMVEFTGDVDGDVSASGNLHKPVMQGQLSLDSVSIYARQAGARYWFDNRPVQIKNNLLLFDKFAIYTTSKNPFTIDGNIDFRNMQRPTAKLDLLARDYTLLNAPRTRESLVYGKVFVDFQAMLRGPLDALTMRGDMNLLGNTDVTYVLTNSPLLVEDRLEGLVSFTSFRDTARLVNEAPVMSLGGMNMLMSVHIDDAVRLRADLSADRSKFVELEGGGDLALQYTPQGTVNLTGRYTLSGGIMKYSLPVIPLKEFNFTNGSYVDWTGNAMNPSLNLTASERVRASVADGDGSSSRMVNFDVSVSINNRLENPELVFNLTAPDDASIQNELMMMGAEERSKQAIAMLATGIYLNNSGKSNLNMGTALNSVLQSQINALAGAAFSVGVEDYSTSETGSKRTDYSFRYSQRFFNDRVQIIIGGKVSTGTNTTNNVESFIDNISLEYRLDNSGTRYIRVFHNKNNESVLDGEITETGVGLVLRRKMDHLGELFIFRKKNRNKQEKE